MSEDSPEARQAGLELVERSRIAMLGTNAGDGHPNVKALIKMENQGLKTDWFSTNTSSRRVAQLMADNRACVYFVAFEKWMGLMLVGEVEVLQDAESRQRLWREGYEKYYPQGVDDPDYTVLKFTARSGHFYHALTKADFKL